MFSIFCAIKERGTVSRTELQQLTGLSWGTITNTTRELLQRNLIREQGAQSTRAGRKPVRLAVDPATHRLIGLDIAGRGGAVARCVMLNLAGETLGYEEFPFDAGDSREHLLQRAGEVVHQLLELPAVSCRNCLGVGLAVPGYLQDPATSEQTATNGWHDTMRRALQERVGVPVRLENDRNCLALAERWFGQAGKAEDLLCLSLGESVGLGILIKGEVFRGSQELAGNFGHTTVEPEGVECVCGDRGCVEAYASVKAVRAYVRSPANGHAGAPGNGSTAAGPSGEATAAELIQAVRDGDAAAREAFARLGKYLGIGIANLLDLFNPDMVVLAGPLAEGKELFLGVLREEVQQHTLARWNREVIVSQLGERATAMGACGIVVQSIFETLPVAPSDALE